MVWNDVAAIGPLRLLAFEAVARGQGIFELLILLHTPRVLESGIHCMVSETRSTSDKTPHPIRYGVVFLV